MGTVKKCFDICLYVKEHCMVKWAAAAGIGILLISGCSHFEGTPRTFDAVKKQAVGLNEVFAYPTDRVIKALVFQFKSRNIDIIRIEYLTEEALILGHQGDMEIETRMIPGLSGGTRVTMTVTRKNQWADYAWVEALYADTQVFLNRKGPANWRHLTEGMLPVHPRPLKDSVPIAFLSPGSRADLMGKEGTWGKIRLVAGGAGYVPYHRLIPDPPSPDNSAL